MPKVFFTRWVWLISLTFLLTSATPTLACGGFFCTTSPINQQAERIIFTQKGNNISAYVQINYTGDDADFAWVVPVPTVPNVDVAEVGLFQELDTLTAPVFIAPSMPQSCFSSADRRSANTGDGFSTVSTVTVYATGTTGPFAYDVIGSEDPQALIQWLKDNGYRIDPPMEPLVQVYVQEKMLFLAMKLSPGKGVQDIQPVKMSYTSSNPMIPLRLTAVAANPNMGVLVWVLGEAQYESSNYAKITIDDSELIGNRLKLEQLGEGWTIGRPPPFLRYATLRSTKIDAVGGQGFITEFAGHTQFLTPIRADVQALFDEFPYVTRLYTELSPAEMTVDPVLRPNRLLPDVSNVHDLSKLFIWLPNCNIVSLVEIYRLWPLAAVLLGLLVIKAAIARRRPNALQN